MTDQEIYEAIHKGLPENAPKLLDIQISHDPDCPRLHGKECTCEPHVKIKEIK
jgi:hypothetical protein